MWSNYFGQSIYLDANVIIYSVEQGSQWSHAAQELLVALDRDVMKAVTSELSIAEVLPKPFQLGNPDYIERYDALLHPTSAIQTVPVSRDILIHSARLQARRGLKLFDAIHVATAEAARCDYFLTEDDRLGRALGDQLKWLRLSEVS